MTNNTQATFIRRTVLGYYFAFGGNYPTRRVWVSPRQLQQGVTVTDKERVFILRQSAIDFFGGADRHQLESMRDTLDGMSHVDEVQAQATIAIIDAILLTGPE